MCVYATVFDAVYLIPGILGENGKRSGTPNFSEEDKIKLFHPDIKCAYCGNEIRSVDDVEVWERRAFASCQGFR